MSIQNVVFDIGNVFVRWAPFEFLETCFPDLNPEDLWKTVRPTWLDLNRGKMTLQDAINCFSKTTKLPAEGFRLFCDQIMRQATLFQDTIALQKRLKDARIPLYCISDNVKEFIAFYYQAYEFMQRFEGAIISADIGILKPDPAIYQALFSQYSLDPATCVFFDDVEANVQGARKMGMTSFIFTDAKRCERDLQTIGIKL